MNQYYLSNRRYKFYSYEANISNHYKICQGYGRIRILRSYLNISPNFLSKIITVSQNTSNNYLRRIIHTSLCCKCLKHTQINKIRWNVYQKKYFFFQQNFILNYSELTIMVFKPDSNIPTTWLELMFIFICLTSCTSCIACWESGKKIFQIIESWKKRCRFFYFRANKTTLLRKCMRNSNLVLKEKKTPITFLKPQVKLHFFAVERFFFTNRLLE